MGFEDVENEEEIIEKDEEITEKDEEVEDVAEEESDESQAKQPAKGKNDTEKYLEQLQRTLAEFDNYKKRTFKEKEESYTSMTIDIMLKFLPVLDNMELAMKAVGDSDKKILEGLNMILKQFKDVLKGYDVQEIKALGEIFNPKLHEAVMHIDDENYGQGEIVEELRKGYMCKDKVLRYSMVKVAN